MAPPGRKNAHTNFYSYLTKLSSAGPEIMKSEIHSYAKSIESSDPVTAQKLLNIVKKYS